MSQWLCSNLWHWLSLYIFTLLYNTMLNCSCRILVGVPNGTTTGHRVEQTGYVLECPLSPGPCAPLRGSGEGNDTLLYDETSGLPMTNIIGRHLLYRSLPNIRICIHITFFCTYTSLLHWATGPAIILHKNTLWHNLDNNQKSRNSLMSNTQLLILYSINQKSAILFCELRVQQPLYRWKCWTAYVSGGILSSNRQRKPLWWENTLLIGKTPSSHTVRGGANYVGLSER